MAPYAKAFPDPSDLHFFDITGFQPLRTFCPARRHRRTGQTHPQHNKNLLYETADLWFHSLVMLAALGQHPQAVLNELDRRFGLSGHAEKAARSEQ